MTDPASSSTHRLLDVLEQLIALPGSPGHPDELQSVAAIVASQMRASGLKVSEKGGVSVYGLGRFPITLYKEQWAKLLDMADEIRAFIKENDSKLKVKE